LAVDVRQVVLVRRPRSDVAAYMFDPAHDLEWTGGITSSRPASPGPFHPGARVERTASFLGRTFSYEYVVTELEPERLAVLKVSRPFPMLVRYELEDAAEGTGTLVAIHAAGTPGRFFGWAAPLMNRQVRKAISGDLDRLRAALEK
jgi:hypothetical protein